MGKLTNSQRQYLRRSAHHLKPIAHIGKNGLTEPVVASVDLGLAAHELIKVKFVDFQDQKQALAQELAVASGSELVGLIGNIAILYRRHPDPEQRQIALPD